MIKATKKAPLGTIEGPGGTVYKVKSSHRLGKVGSAHLGGNEYRVRVQLNSKVTIPALEDAGYSSPVARNPRYSVVVNGTAAMSKHVKFASLALQKFGRSEAAKRGAKTLATKKAEAKKLIKKSK